MSKGSDTPTPPDYQSLAQQQFGYQQTSSGQQAEQQHSNASGPYGSTSWQDPNGPLGQWEGTTTLSPNQQTILNNQETGQIQAGNVGSNLWNSVAGTVAPIDYSGVQQVKGGAYNDQQAQNAVWNQFTSMQQPLQQQQLQQQQAALEGQGLRPGDAAYYTQMKNLMNTQYGQTQNAMNQAVLAGNQQAQTNQGMDVSAQNAQLGFLNQKAGGNLNLLSQVYGLAGGPHTPNAAAPGTGVNAGAPDLSGAAGNQYNAAINAANAQNAAAGQTNAAAGSAITSAILYAAMA
jgi:hypothetical protein